MTTIPPIVDYGLVSGLNTQQIIQAELGPFQAPENNLLAEQATINTNVTDYQQINTDLAALQTQAQTLAVSSGWAARQATSSASTVATATASPGTPTGSVQFTVSQLAAANSLVSSGSVSATSQIVDSSPGYLLSQGAAQIGFSQLAAGSGLTLGAHTVKVTQASEAASTTGTVALGSQSSGITVGSTNDTVNVTVNGTAYTLTIASSPSGGYSGSGLLSAVQSAISGAGASGMAAGYDANGNLILSTTSQGATQSLQVTGGTALATLGLASMGAAASGVDGIVSVDGTSTTLSTVTAGASATLAAPSSTSVTGTVAGASSQSQVNSSLLSVGSLTATNVSTGNGSLADVVSNINAAATGITASAVQTGTSAYVLQLSSSQTGTNADLSVSTSAFSSSSLGALKTATAGANAQIQVGGSGGYTLSSQNDTFTGLLPGLSITALNTSTNPVTVTVSPDASAMASQIQTLVTDANTALSDIQKFGGYNAATKTGGPLMGSAVLQEATNQIQSIIGSVSGTSTLGNALSVGLTLSNGQVQFDQSTFESAFNANPSQVANMFTQGGTFAPASSPYTGQVSLSYASNTTKSGTYAVVLDQSAQQATDTGAALSAGTVSAGEQLTVTMGSGSVKYTTTSGQSLTAIAQGLNAAFASSGFALSAQVVNSGTQLQLTSDAYGSATSFSVSTTSNASGTTGLTGSGTSATSTGVDVAGTINGVAATGIGQFLSAPASDPTLSGMSLQVTTSGVTSATSLGSFTYSPGIAQQLATLGNAMSNPTTGSVTQTITGLQSESQGLTPQISFYANIVAQERKLLMAQYATLEATLGSLKNQSSALTGQLAGLAANGP